MRRASRIPVSVPLTRAPLPPPFLFCSCRDERKEQIGAAMAARQKKRTDNIAQRNERRSDKRKGTKPKASSKARPGFEGKAFGKGKGKKKGK